MGFFGTSQQVYSEWIPSMTTRLEISIVATERDAKKAKRLIQEGFAEANRIIKIISAWEKGTELYEVNAQAGVRTVAVSDELFYLLKRSIHISRLTGGLFDITFASIDKVWYFDRPMKEMPTEEEIRNSVARIGYQHIHLDETAKTVYIDQPGTKIELGAIGKGYIANKIKDRMVQAGITGGLVNAGGDLTCWGKNEKGEKWRIGVADPAGKEKFIAWLPIENCGVATSGAYERFAVLNGEKFSHIIHPFTGYPVKGIQSVTVISPDAELCDAVATSVFLMGTEEGLRFVNQFHDIQCYIVDDTHTFHYSDNLQQISYTTHDA